MNRKFFNILLVLLAVISLVSGVKLAQRAPKQPSISDVWGTSTAGGMANGASALGRNGNNEIVQFREEHKFTFQLIRVAGGLQRLERTNYPLSPEQAQRILAVLTPLQKKPKLSQEDARTAMKAVLSVLTVDQRTAMAEQPQRRRRRPGGGQGLRNGGRQNAGQQQAFDSVKMKDFNPFLPSAQASLPMGNAFSADRLFTYLENVRSGNMESDMPMW